MIAYGRRVSSELRELGVATSPEPQREMFQRKMGRFKPSKNWFENTSFSSSPLRPFPSPLAKSKQSPVGHRCYFQSSHGASTSYVGGQRPVGIGKDNNSSSRHHFDTTEDTNLPVNYLSRDSTKIRSGITQKHTSPKRSGLVQGWESFQQQDCMNLREKVQQQHRSRSPWRPLSQESVWKNTSCELTATQKLDKMLHRIRTIAASPRKAPIRDPILDEFLRKRRSKRSNYLRDSNAPSTSQVYQQGSLLAGTGSSMLRELKASSIESFDSPGMLNSTPSKTMSPFPWGCSKLRPAWPSRQAAPASPRDKGSRSRSTSPPYYFRSRSPRTPLCSKSRPSPASPNLYSPRSPISTPINTSHETAGSIQEHMGRLQELKDRIQSIASNT